MSDASTQFTRWTCEVREGKGEPVEDDGLNLEMIETGLSVSYAVF